MQQIDDDLERLLNQLVRSLALDVDDKTNAARVVLVARVVQASGIRRGSPPDVGCSHTAAPIFGTGLVRVDRRVWSSGRTMGSERRMLMNSVTAGFSRRVRRRMMLTGRTRGPSCSACCKGTLTSVRLSTSRRSVGSGSIAMPAPSSIACLMFSMLSNAAVIAHLGCRVVGGI